MTPIPIAVLSLGMDPTIPMRSMKKPIAPIPARYNGRRPIRPITEIQPRYSLYNSRYIAVPVARMFTDWTPMLKFWWDQLKHDRIDKYEERLTKAWV